MLEIGGIGLLTAFAAGLISFLSPCVLPLVPGYVSYIAGDTVSAGSSRSRGALRISTVALSGCFVLGFSSIFLLLGASASALGRALGAILTVSATSPDAAAGLALLATYAAGLAVPFLLAAFFTGAFAARMGQMRILGRALRVVTAGIMILMGMAMITGTMTTLNYWILDLLPVLQRIG